MNSVLTASLLLVTFANKVDDVNIEHTLCCKKLAKMSNLRAIIYRAIRLFWRKVRRTAHFLQKILKTVRHFRTKYHQMSFLLWAKTKSVALFTLCFDGTVAVEVNKLRERIKSGKVHFLLQLARFEHTLHVDYRMIRIHVRWITNLSIIYIYQVTKKFVTIVGTYFVIHIIYVTFLRSMKA